ncbi:hypothetical protein LTR70_002368 [Exophiala xenobiotica]|uniref:Endoplasmic reticulum-based factor for assembly of V-ATPase-domain-containing protein n=1 Tax=Lithohypha guttulata TaxID=1690604 RepID=A0ABR0KMD0_9EURO|nr:hypothetical protein LTR24_001365 [Lithohypha guttulata]KAK5325397.1 hypothetical protein LTR70_002368 [Exophiala xenobiotica]
MVLLTTTPTILAAISSLPSDSLPTQSLPTSTDNPISHTTLLTLSRCLRKWSPSYTLNTLLRGTKPYIAPPPPKPEPSAEYKALMARLRADQERREYRAMVAKQEAESQQALSGQIGTDRDEEEGKDDISPSLVLNIVLSVVMCAGVAFHLTRWWPNDGVRVLVSLGTAILVGVAEVTVYAAYLRKVEESKTMERRKKERKELIGEYTGSGEGVDMDIGNGKSAEVEKTEIWGRGVHGGMRRRVREKWEKEQEKA